MTPVLRAFVTWRAGSSQDPAWFQDRCWGHLQEPLEQISRSVLATVIRVLPILGLLSTGVISQGVRTTTLVGGLMCVALATFGGYHAARCGLLLRAGAIGLYRRSADDERARLTGHERLRYTQPTALEARS